MVFQVHPRPDFPSGNTALLMAMPRTSRLLSAFAPSTRLWMPVRSAVGFNAPIGKFNLLTWNIDAFAPRPIVRTSAILDHILGQDDAVCDDVVFLQEVTRDVRRFLLCDKRIQSRFFITDAEDEAALTGVPFMTMTLLSKSSFRSYEETTVATAACTITRYGLPSEYRRDALCTEVLLPPKPSTSSTSDTWPLLRLVNLHLDSLGWTFDVRKEQVSAVGHILRGEYLEDDGRPLNGIAAGDFNAISNSDEGLIEGQGWTDAWIGLCGDRGGAHQGDGMTWHQSKERQTSDRHGAPKRLDRIALTKGIRPLAVKILHPGTVSVPKPGEEEDGQIRWSDHSGLRCSVVIES